jgi:hypothetical protein
MKLQRQSIFAVLLCAIGWIGDGQLFAQDADSWLTGKALERQLAAPLSLHSTGTPLRAQLESIARTQRVAILLDRRVDPDQTVQAELSNAPLWDALQAIAGERGLGVSRVDSVVYIAPSGAAADLRTVALLARDRVAELPPNVRRKLLARKSWSWPELSEPGDLFAELQSEAGLPISGLETIPHDLWPAVSLPPMTLIDRMTLAAYGFGRMPVVSRDGATIALAAPPSPARLVRSYAPPRDKPLGQVVEQIRKAAPKVEIKISGGKIWARGREEDLEQVARILSGKPEQPPDVAPNPPVAGIDVYTLKIIDAKIGPLLKQLAGKLDIEVRFDQEAIDAAGISLDQRVSFEVTRAQLNDLLAAAVKPAGLTFERKGRVVTVRPAP